MSQPRFLIAAGASGSGKTLITCGILQALYNRGMKVSSFKCGPDYIDPMFHSKVLKAKSGNLDTYFTDPETTRYLFAKNAADTDISVMEGVMGYYDGLGGTSLEASTWELAQITQTPVILVVNCRGMSRSVVAFIKGFLEYTKDSQIKGVVLNQMSAMLYPRMKQMIEEELGVQVFGYVPKVTECLIESRHLGLVMPDEIEGLEVKLNRLAEILEDTLELDNLIKLAGDAPKMKGTAPGFKKLNEKPIIAVAKDEAFCFMYQDNLSLLEEMGAEIAYFSPIHDKELPPKAQGLILYGGYPELFAKELCSNESMKRDILLKVSSGMPCLAECGGFMYLHETMEDMQGESFEMTGVIEGKAFKTDKLGRFGYIELAPLHKQMLGTDFGTIKAHEFHYFESTCCGDRFRAKKPIGNRGWECVCGSDTMIAGFPHLYYYSNPEVPYRFLKKCADFGGKGK